MNKYIYIITYTSESRLVIEKTMQGILDLIDEADNDMNKDIHSVINSIEIYEIELNIGILQYKIYRKNDKIDHWYNLNFETGENNE